MDDFVGLDEIEIAEIKFVVPAVAPACVQSYSAALPDPIQPVELGAHYGSAGKPLANGRLTTSPADGLSISFS